MSFYISPEKRAEIAKRFDSYAKNAKISAPKAPSYDLRILFANDQKEKAIKGYIMTGRGKSFRISEDHPSIEGVHLLGHEGDLGSYAYYKKAPKKEKKAVMTRAWVIAKEAVAKFGGKASQYFSGALKAAWAE